LVGVMLERWEPRVVASAMAVVFIVYAVLWGGLVLLSQRRNPQAWTAAQNPTTSEWPTQAGE
jgi:hypothetical protein